jgi:hypothetical protein
LAEEPQPGKLIAAEKLPDHRIDYLDYEGPVSQDRGSVRRWDAGEYAVVEESSTRLTIVFAGRRLRGTAILEATPRATEPPPWTMYLAAGEAERPFTPL